MNGNLDSILFGHLTLFNVSPHLQILPIYCVLFLFLPVAIVLVRYSNILTVFGLSLAVWVMSQFGLKVAIGVYNILSWQLLFFGGVCVGVYNTERSLVNTPKTPILSRATQLVLFILFFILFFLNLSNHSAFTFAGLISTLQILSSEAGVYNYVSKINLGPLRVLNLICVASVVYTLTLALPYLFSVKKIELLGRHSLQLFTFQIFWVFFLAAVKIKLSEVSIYLNLAFSVVIVLSMFLVVALYSKLKQKLIVECDFLRCWSRLWLALNK